MMLFKLISLTLISCLYLQNFATSLNQCVYKNDKYMYAETPDETKYELEGEQYEFNGEQFKLLSSLPNKNIKLFARESCNYPGLFNKFLLSVDGRKKLFSWKSAINDRPRLILSDINNDKVEELIIVLTIGTGTGYLKQEPHIINMNHMHE